MSQLSQFLKGGVDPSKAAMPYFDQIPDMLKQYLDPYISGGLDVQDSLKSGYTEMADDPMGLLEQILSGYKPSAGYEQALGEATRAASNTSAAGGYRGTPLDAQTQGNIAGKLAGEDMQRFIENILGIKTTGLAGEKGLFDVGFDASKGLSGDLSNVLGTQGSLAFQGQREQNQQQQDLFKSLMGLLGEGIGFGSSGMGVR